MYPLLAKLIEIESSPWAEWNRGKPLTPTSLARLLKLFAISPGAVRDSGVVFKGYERNSFTDAWDRYRTKPWMQDWPSPR